jgi:hypothetical protein
MNTLHSLPLSESPDQQKQHQQQQEHQPLHPFLIPELVLAIGAHLSQAQALQAVLVCKTWYACLIPILYQRVTLGRKKQTANGTKRAQRPMLGVLQRYGSHVRTLLCPENYAALRLAAPLCCSIETLVLGPLSDEVLEILRRNKETIRRLEFRRNKSLTTLTFAETRRLRQFPPDHILNLLETMPQLQILSIHCLVFRIQSQLTTFFRICERLLALELVGEFMVAFVSDDPESNISQSWGMNHRLRSLSLIDSMISGREELALLDHCPNLENFSKRNETFGILTHLLFVMDLPLQETGSWQRR